MEKGSGGGVGGHMSEEDGDDAVCTATKLQAIPGYCICGSVRVKSYLWLLHLVMKLSQES